MVSARDQNALYSCVSAAYGLSRAEEAAAVKYTCPMHPKILQEKPGMCPICGMSLVATKQKSGAVNTHAHDTHEGHHTNDLLKKFYITIALTVPVLLYSEIFMIAFKWNAPRFPGVDMIVLEIGRAHV